MTDEGEEKRRHAAQALRFLKWQRVLSPSVIGAWTVLVAVVGGFVSGYKWIETQKFEARKPFLEIRLKTYIEVAKITGAITDEKLDTASDIWKTNAERFISMRWGELELLGDAGIRNAARLVTEYIRETERPGSKFERHNLRWAIECLSDELRFSLENDWGQDDGARISAMTKSSVSSLPEGCSSGRDPARRRRGMPPPEATPPPNSTY